MLTSRQRRQPHIGTGLAAPVSFGPTPLEGRLITRRAARIDLRDLPLAMPAGRSSHIDVPNRVFGEASVI